MYASLIPNKTYEHNGMCITADYSFIRSTPHALFGKLFYQFHLCYANVSFDIKFATR